jgi:hypothetical protein
MNCRGCGGPTKEKTTKVGICYECIGACKDPKKPQYALASWPKKATHEAPAGQEVGLLMEIIKILLRIEKILANPKQVHISTNEMEPDENVPF